MKEKSFDDIASKFREFNTHEDFDLIVGIASGGIVPAYLISHHLKKPLEFIRINFRDAENKQQHESPVLIKPFDFDFNDKTILLVDDRTESGQTFNFAKELLRGAKNIKTFAVNGKADYFLFDEECFKEPWNI